MNGTLMYIIEIASKGFGKPYYGMYCIYKPDLVMLVNVSESVSPIKGEIPERRM
jgi:hypothetical protein